MEDLLLQKGCLKVCLCGFLKDLICELILFAFMYFACVGLVFVCFGLVLGVRLLSAVCLLSGVCRMWSGLVSPWSEVV